MAVHQLCREADRVARDRLLTALVELAVRERRVHDLELQLREEAVPERVKLEHIQSHRNSQLAAESLNGAVGLEQTELVLVHIHARSRGLSRDRSLAAVARDELSSAAEGVDRQAAVVVAQTAVRHLDLVNEVAQRLRVGKAAPALAL